MKRLSIKFKITFWYTLVMTLVVTAVLTILFVIGERIVFDESHEKLIDAVNESFSEIKFRFGELDVDDDLDYYNDGVYISVYTADHSLIYGRLPSDFDRSVPFSEGAITTIGSGETAKYVYDLTQDVGHGCMVTVRGVLSASGSEHAFSAMINLAFIILPLLIVIASLFGYLFTKRAFLPVKRIADAAEQINNGNDLTKRIGLESGKDEIHKLAKEIDSMLNRLQESFENEKRFTSDASHELRTPIAVIIAEAENLLNNTSIDNESRAALELIHAKATNMSRLISGLLTLARADRGHIKLIKSEINLSEMTEMVCEQINEYASEKAITVDTDIEPNVYIDGDETMIIRLLLNLCENGIKYGRENGKLMISLVSGDGFAVCSVRDDGIGISTENIDKIWERFFREDEARTHGSGLGLPLSKYICEAHCGSIRVESTKGCGSNFEFKIPLKA